jgi:hypothetical protein
MLNMRCAIGTTYLCIQHNTWHPFTCDIIAASRRFHELACKAVRALARNAGGAISIKKVGYLLRSVHMH